MHINNNKNPKPVMAVLENSKSISNLKKQIANSRIQHMVKANNEVKNTLYFFSLKDVKLSEKKITGFYWHEKHKKWIHRDYPLPDILYIRCGVNKQYYRTFKELCKIITNNNGKLITHYRFNKWRLYQVMTKDPSIKSYLPATKTVKHPHHIQEMLQRYNVVYLKSHIGKKGENVLRVEVLPSGDYQYSYYRHGLLTVRLISGFQALLDVVNNFFQGKKYLIQQGIDLIEYNHRLIDMRAELQYKGNGVLEIVGVSVRSGQPGSPITTHGEAYKFDDFFAKKMGYSKSQLKAFRSRVHGFLFSVYEYIEKYYGKYAEMGIDFAIDTKKNIWFIEANSRSTHASLDKAYGKAALYKYHKNILEYARYLFTRSNRSVTH